MKQIRLFRLDAPSAPERGQLNLFASHLAVQPSSHLAVQPSSLERSSARAREFAAAARAPATRRAYAREWEGFARWCEEREIDSLPAAGPTVAAYLAELAERRLVAGIAVALAAITAVHRAKGLRSPREHMAVGDTWRGIRRELGVRPRQKAPLLVEGLRCALASLPKSLAGLRDRALLLLGWAAALRRAELVALQVEDVREVDKGLEVVVRRNKTDQEGKGRLLGVPRGRHESTCPVAAVRAWTGRIGISSGPLFRRLDRWGRARAGAVSPHYVARLVKRAARAAGLDPRQFSGHSLRAGFTTAAADAGRTERQIMRTTGHGSEQMVRRYIRRAELFTDLADDLGL